MHCVLCQRQIQDGEPYLCTTQGNVVHTTCADRAATRMSWEHVTDPSWLFARLRLFWRTEWNKSTTNR